MRIFTQYAVISYAYIYQNEDFHFKIYFEFKKNYNLIVIN